MQAFHDRSDSERMEFRIEIETFGALIRSYDGDGGITVAVPVGGENLLESAATVHSLTVQSFFQFPLGTDRPEEHLRHNSWSYHRKGDAPSCWLFAKLLPGAG